MCGDFKKCTENGIKRELKFGAEVLEIHASERFSKSLCEMHIIDKTSRDFKKQVFFFFSAEHTYLFVPFFYDSLKSISTGHAWFYSDPASSTPCLQMICPEGDLGCGC